MNAVTRKKKPSSGWMVYALVPVNVRVVAKSKRGAERLALRALNRTSPLELSSDDNATYQGMYIDDGVPAVLDTTSKCPTAVRVTKGNPAVAFVNEESR